MASYNGIHRSSQAFGNVSSASSDLLRFPSSTIHLDLLRRPPMGMKLRSAPDGGFPSYTIQTRSLSYDLPSDADLWDQLLRGWRTGGGGVHDRSRNRSNSKRRFQCRILKDVSCEARPGQVTAIVGPSGAGKSTLLSVLAGVIPMRRLRGEVLVNGREMDVGRFRRVSGYVTQDDDSLFQLLTVEETLRYSARLRLRAAGKKEVADRRVAELAKDLRLDGQEVMERRVGSVSGGERRRVSIGVELVHDPAVLLLDEPTSGLDSASALQIVALLNSMATVNGKTIVLTIHQPGYRILELFDRIILVSGGTVCHNGSLCLLSKRLANAGHVIPPHINLLDYAMDTITFTTPSSTSSPSSLSSPSSTPSERSETTTGDPENLKTVYANSYLKETIILGERFFSNILRTNQLFTARLIQSTIAGILLGTIFLKTTDLQSKLGFFAFTLTFLLSSTTEGLPIFLQERTILTRETTRGAYRISSYVTANAVIFLPFLLSVAILYSLPAYWMVGLRRDPTAFLYFTLVIWLVVLMANSFVSFFSALVPNFIIGNSIIAGFMGSFFLFSGYFISKDNIPKYWIFMHYLSLFKYPFEAFLANEYGGCGGRGGRKAVCVEWGKEGECVLDGITFLRQQGVGENKLWTNVGVMIGFIAGYRLLCFIILWVRCHNLRR